MRNRPSPAIIPPGRRPRCLLIALLALPLAALPGLAADQPGGSPEQKKERIEQGIKKATINIGRLQEGIKHQEEQVRSTKKVELTLLTELQDIDSRLASQNHKIETLAARIERQRELVAEKNEERERTTVLLRAVQEHVKKRMQSFYRLGELGLIHITFSDRSLPELLRFQDSFLDLIKYDRQLIDTYRNTIAELGQAVESLQLQENIFAGLLDENRQEQRSLGAMKAEKEALLTRIRTQSKLHEQAALEMEQAADSLTDTLKGLRTEEKKIEQGFLYYRGTHPPPVKGRVVARFQEQTTNLLGITSVSKGIAIDAPSGSTVRAIHQGLVHYSGYLRGYGNTVIVDHGHQYYSISARMERLFVDKGQRVEQGTEIGIMGDTATLISPGLYFELRKDTEHLDPLDWLDKSGLNM